jgi:hypothetical protein
MFIFPLPHFHNSTSLFYASVSLMTVDISDTWNHAIFRFQRLPVHHGESLLIDFFAEHSGRCKCQICHVKL